MENKSQDNQHRRHRGNRSGGRNRQGNQNQSGNSGGNRNRSRNRNRNRGGSRTGKSSRPTFLQRVLSVLTFGLLGKSGAKPAQKKAVRTDSVKPAPKGDAARKPARDGDRPKRNRNEVTSGRLYVGNLDYATGESELEDLFRGVGNVLSAEVVTNPRTQQSKGFAFVEMGSIEEAKRAVKVLDDQDFMGRKLIVSGARSEGPHDEPREEAALAETSPDR